MVCGECQKKEQKCQQMTYFVVKWHADKVDWNKYCGNRKKNPKTRDLCIPKEVFTKPEKNAEKWRRKSRHQRWSLCRIEPFQWRWSRILIMIRAHFHVMERCEGSSKNTAITQNKIRAWSFSYSNDERTHWMFSYSLQVLNKRGHLGFNPLLLYWFIASGLLQFSNDNGLTTR